MRIKVVGLAVGVVMAGGAIVGASSTHAGQAASDSPSGGDERPAHAPSPAVSESERARVAAAIRRQDPEVVLRAVRRGPDGTFHVLGSKAGEPVLAEVSKAYARVTVQERAG